MICEQFREKKVIIILLLIVWIEVGYSQLSQDSIQSKCYIGLSGAFSPERYKYSTYLLELGGHILYNWNQNFLAFSYNRLFAFHFDDEYDNSKFHRLELVYGIVSCLKEDHKLFRHIFVGVSVGVSYNIISYYEDDISYDRNRISKTKRFGLPVGILITSPIGKRIFGGMGYVYQIISKEKPYMSFRYFAMINIL